MAILDMTLRPANYKEYVGLSTDEKPTDGVAVNSLFRELDTNDTYYFTGETWAKVGGDTTTGGDTTM